MRANDIESYIASVKERVDLFIEQHYTQNRGEIPDILYDAINYAVFPGGKMIRPSIVFGFCEEMGGDTKKALPVASAIELIHTFSLIHDDLPSVDNDDYRRGRKTLHRQYSEAIALLTGDALLADAFGIVASSDLLGDSVRCRIIALISRFVGSSGMIGGQVLDIESQKDISGADFERIIRMKTADMFILSSLSGAICSGGDFDEQEVIQFGENFGLIFQLTDDILDFEQDKKGSVNIVEHKGVATAFEMLDRAYENTLVRIENLGLNSGIIKGITDMVFKRVEHIRDQQVT